MILNMIEEKGTEFLSLDNTASFLEVLYLNISTNLTQSAHLSLQKNSTLKNPRLQKNVFNVSYMSI